MSGEHQQPPVAPAAGIPDLFRNAIAALTNGVDRKHSDEFTGRAEELRNSARFLADAFLAARGSRPATDSDRVEILNSHPIIDHDTDRPLIDLLTFDPPARWSEGRMEELRQLERKYRATMPCFRAALAGEMPAYGDAIRLFKDAAGKRPVKGVFAGLTAVVILTVSAYHFADPAYVFQLSGQVFWKRVPGEPFAEERSQSFEVHVDGTAHDYLITFEEPVRISSLRVDPVNKADATEVEIQQVRLLAPGGISHGGFDDFTAWACTNCRWLARSERGGRLRPGNDDPYVIAPPVDPIEVSRIQITMRASAEKTFWEWVTRLEKKN